MNRPKVMCVTSEHGERCVMLEFDNAGLTMTVSIPADDALQLFIDLGRVLARMEQGETSPAE